LITRGEYNENRDDTQATTGLTAHNSPLDQSVRSTFATQENNEICIADQRIPLSDQGAKTTREPDFQGGDRSRTAATTAVRDDQVLLRCCRLGLR
jgi:hypothetical protein